MDSWENEEFEVTKPTNSNSVTANKWEGEDEDYDVKDSWDDPEEEKQQEDEAKSQPVGAKKSKKLLDRKIEEKERKRREEIERKRADMTPEEILADKLRSKQLQEESDLLLAKQLLGIDVPSAGLDTQEDFEKFKDDIINKIGDSTKKEFFPSFVELLVQSLCVHLNSADLKKISTWLNNLHIEKLKIEKGDKIKKSKGKGKTKLKLEGETDYNEFSAYTEDYDDFM